jgi:MerR family transcriptional regulator, thiopeptide resistance regulator
VNGYRFYEEKQLLILQQILFSRELGFELKQIQKVLGRSDFDQMAALSSHRQVLEKDLKRTKELIKTIDKTIDHLKGTKKMKTGIKPIGKNFPKNGMKFAKSLPNS